MTAIGVFLIVVGWFMAVGFGVMANSPRHDTWNRVTAMLTSAGLISSGVYILTI